MKGLQGILHHLSHAVVSRQRTPAPTYLNDGEGARVELPDLLRSEHIVTDFGPAKQISASGLNKECTKKNVAQQNI